eukprot:scaffold1178_cov252-Pinguiococcus_pyrenoidosus.AAC.38
MHVMHESYFCDNDIQTTIGARLLILLPSSIAIDRCSKPDREEVGLFLYQGLAPLSSSVGASFDVEERSCGPPTEALVCSGLPNVHDEDECCDEQKDQDGNADPQSDPRAHGQSKAPNDLAAQEHDVDHAIIVDVCGMSGLATLASTRCAAERARSHSPTIRGSATIA